MTIKKKYRKQLNLWIDKHRNVYFDGKGVLHAPNNKYSGDIYLSANRQKVLCLDKDKWAENKAIMRTLVIPKGFVFEGNLFIKAMRIIIEDDVYVSGDCCFINTHADQKKSDLGVYVDLSIGRNFEVGRFFRILSGTFIKRLPINLKAGWLLISNNPFIKELPEFWEILHCGKIFSSAIESVPNKLSNVQIINDNNENDFADFPLQDSPQYLNNNCDDTDSLQQENLYQTSESYELEIFEDNSMEFQHPADNPFIESFGF